MHWVLIPLAGIWSMDRNTAFNFMISRPFVVSAVIGAIGGNFFWCLAGGILFETIGLLDLPVGTRISRDDTFSAFSYCTSVAFIQNPTIEYALAAAAISYLLIYPATLSIFFMRWMNKRLYSRFPVGREKMLIIIGQCFSFLRGVMIYPVGAIVTQYILSLTVGLAPSPVVSAFTGTVVVCLIAGYSMGFLHNTVGVKFMLFITGGVLSWLIL